MLGSQKFNLDRTVRLIIALLGLWAVILLLRELSSALLPFMIASGLAYLLHPMVSWLEKRCGYRGLAVVLCMSSFVFVLWACVVYVYPRLLEEIQQLAHLLKPLEEQSQWSAIAKEKLPDNVWLWLREQLLSPEMKAWIKDGGVSSVLPLLKPLAPSFLGVIMGAKSVLLAVMGASVILLYMFFILLDYRSLVLGAQRMIPREWSGLVRQFGGDFDRALSQYFRAQSMVAAIVGLCFGLGFSWAGLPMPWFLGLMMGVLNLVPYLQLLGLIPVAVLALLTVLQGESSLSSMALQCGIVVLVVQSLQDMVIVPKVMGKASGLSPAIMLLSLSVWGQLLGFFGLVIAIPLTCLMLAWYQAWIRSGSFGPRDTSAEAGLEAVEKSEDSPAESTRE